MRTLDPTALGAELQELKEAVCDALVNLTVERVSGGGDLGEQVYDARPTRSVVSGQLLPRHDEHGEDESSDISISTLGMDLELRAEGRGEAIVTPRFSIYVRVLPSWADLQDRGRCGPVDFRLVAEVQREIDDFIRAERTRRFEEDDLIAGAREGEEDWAERAARRRAIRDAVTVEAYRRHNIELRPEDLAQDEDPADTAGGDEADEADDGLDPNVDSTVDISVPPPPPVGRWLGDGRSVPYNLLQPADIPPKWRRLDLVLPPLPFEISEAPATAASAYSEMMRRAAREAVRNWLGSPDGLANAWRQGQVRPDDIETEATWEMLLVRLRQAPPPVDRLMPELNGVEVTIDRMADYRDAARANLRVTLENNNNRLPSRVKTRTDAIFLTSLKLDVPETAYLPLRLDRVEPSYRYRHHLEYPALGLNCGIVAERLGDRVQLATTWAPRFVQPRIQPRAIDLSTTYARLSAEDFDPAELLELPAAYRRWIEAVRPRLEREVGDGLSPDDAAHERLRLAEDIAGQEAEARLIERGVRLLMRSRAVAAATAGPSPEAAPWRAWIYTNRSFLRRNRGDARAGWRLFQLAFILAHLPVIASRMPEFADVFDAQADEEAASLLYFPTGGGKSEAFYGTLIFNLFLDRLRGKNRGVTALVRYPLRLLTLQQAQRFLRLLVWAELTRQDAERDGIGIGAWPFEIGFWVGGTNTPNRFSGVPAQVPYESDELADDSSFGAPDQGAPYWDAWKSLNKMPSCPCCSETTGLRRVRGRLDEEHRVAIVCFDSRCAWNEAKGRRTPLPFLLTDDAIYGRAPAVILGTLDKMALLGQSASTITQVIGMFGAARWVSPDGFLFTPRTHDQLAAGPVASGFLPVRPAYVEGERVFHDPFPSLIVQDEAHLLEESLGAFSGLFETLFEQILRRIGDIAGGELACARWPSGAHAGAIRSPKIIAATATVSEPARQLAALYQRTPLRFPYPGPDLYESFFARPAETSNPIRLAYAESLSPWSRAERTAPWSRLYVSLMTNGANHTVTSVRALSTFHLLVTELWRALQDDARRDAAAARLAAAIPHTIDGEWRRAALDAAAAAGRYDLLVAMLDLHRISLAYVTNKKGGDQIMDALEGEISRDHLRAGEDLSGFDSELISGGVNMQDIQDVMTRAEAAYPPGGDYPDVSALMRSVIATSAISHGVDVDRFNSMFFAGLPSDIAEYIQASSRVGRSHVGFVMLIPTPQSRQDRFVVESHDIFHRFLERMIAPPAIERWAEHAVARVMASLLQAWAILREAESFRELPDDRKASTPQFGYVDTLARLARNNRVALQDELTRFMLAAVGFQGRGSDAVGRPVYAEMYERMIDRTVEELVRHLAGLETQISLRDYWKAPGHSFKPPMTSLRDVDEAGSILPSYVDPLLGQRVGKTALVRVMRQVRRQRGASDIDAVEGS